MSDNEFLSIYNKIVTILKKGESMSKSLEHQEKCENCLKPLPKRHHTHINKYQDQKVHKFCSKECKIKWIQKF